MKEARRATMSELLQIVPTSRAFVSTQLCTSRPRRDA